MKKTAPLLALLFLLLLPSLAHGASDRSIANKTLSAREASATRFEKLQFSTAFRESATNQAKCANDISESLKSSTEMTNNEKVGALFAVLILWMVDFTVDASRDQIIFIDKESARLQNISSSLMRQASSARGRQIARSLQGHSLKISGTARFEGGVDFCQVKGAIEEAGGYTAANFNKAFEDQSKWTASPDISASMKRGDKMIERGVKAMRSVKPPLPAKRIDNYDELLSYSMVLKSKIFAARVAGKVSFGEVSFGDARRALQYFQ